jgi:hypothetical protein
MPFHNDHEASTNRYEIFLDSAPLEPHQRVTNLPVCTYSRPCTQNSSGTRSRRSPRTRSQSPPQAHRDHNGRCIHHPTSSPCGQGSAHLTRHMRFRMVASSHPQCTVERVISRSAFAETRPSTSRTRTAKTPATINLFSHTVYIQHALGSNSSDGYQISESARNALSQPHAPSKDFFMSMS